MKSFEYVHAHSLEEAQKFAGSDWNSRLLYAGGTDQLSMIKHDIDRPDRLVNLKRIPHLNKLEKGREGLRIGSLVTVSDLVKDPHIKKNYTVLYEAAMHIATPQLRNMATVGGNLCQRPRCWYFRGDFPCIRKGGDTCFAVGGENKYHCIIGGDPCFIVHPSDLAVALMALDARVVIYDNHKEEKTALKDFFVLPEKDPLRENRLQPGQIITAVEIPAPAPGTWSHYDKVKERGSWDFALVSAALVVSGDKRKITSGRLAFGGVAPVPWMDEDIIRQLADLSTEKAALKGFSEKLFRDAVTLGQNEYKIRMARNLVLSMMDDYISEVKN